MSAERRPSVCVIGAGVAGLVTAKTLIADGFDVQVIERDSELGGTWAPSRSYPGLRTNNSKQTYEFSDFQYPEATNAFPSAEDVRTYLSSYVRHFDIESSIHCNREVVDVSRSSRDDHLLAVTSRSTDGTGEDQVAEFDFVAVCNGVFNVPSIPVLEGQDSFRGRSLHSSEVTAASYGSGDRIVVVGGGKSAFDCAAWAAGQRLTPTLLYRRAQWMAPRYLPGGRIPGDWLVTSRLMSLFLRYYHSSRAELLMHTIGRPVVRLWWALIALGWRKDLGIPRDPVPVERLPLGLEKVGVGGDFYDALNAGEAQIVLGEIRRFHPDGVELHDGNVLQADVVVFAMHWLSEHCLSGFAV